MSFSFSAQGTKAQTLDSLRKVQDYGGGLGGKIRDLLVETVEAGPSEHPNPAMEPWYTVSAYGHSAEGSALSMSVSLACSYQPKPDPEPVQPADPPHGPGGF